MLETAKKPTDEQANEFWKAVAEAKWGMKADYEKIKLMFLRKWTPKQTKQMNEVYKYLYNKLYRACNAVVEDLGDDGFGDLLSHIIGLGRTEYERVLANPKLAATRADNNQFKECFSYCLPYEEDYEKLKPEFYDEWAARAAKDLAIHMKDKRTHPEAVRAMREVACRLVDAVGQPLALLEHEKEVLKNLNTIEEYGSRYNKHQVVNLMRDLERYLAVERAA
jgi:hypothetical protein